MRNLLFALVVLLGTQSASQAGIVTVGQFLADCKTNQSSCMAFVMGVVEGARHQVREERKAQPYSFSFHGQLICVPKSWGSLKLTETVVAELQAEPKTFRYSAVSGVVYALAQVAACQGV